MSNEEDEEKILMKREYYHHMKVVGKAKARERHFELKTMGYALGKDKLRENEDIIAVFLGYISGLKINRKRVYGRLASLIIDSSNGLFANIRNILRNKTTDENLIIREMSKK
jgi:hypothetical protein